MKSVTRRLLASFVLLSGSLVAGQTPATSSAETSTPQPAQEAAAVPRLKTPSEAGPPTTLATTLKREIVPGRKVTLVTQAKPLLRQECKVEKYEEDAIVCRSRSGPVSFRAQDLVAVIGPVNEFRTRTPFRLLSTLGLGGGAIAGAALLASIPMAGVPLAVVGAILLLDSIFEGVDLAGAGHTEKLLFLNPDQNLQIDLK